MTIISTTTETWAIISVLGVTTLTLVVPAVWLAWAVVARCLDGGFDATVARVEHFVELRDRARRAA